MKGGSETHCKIYLTHCTYSQQITSTTYCSVVQKKKKAQPKSWEICFIRQISEDVGPEDSLSDSSEGLLQRGEG